MTATTLPGDMAAIGLMLASGLHATWAMGSTWPAKDPEDLADLVVGTQPFPSAGATWAVSALTAAAAGLVTLDNHDLVKQPRLRRLVRLGATTVSGVLALRGGVGLAADVSGKGPGSDRFRYWDLRCYSPLCLALAALAGCGPRTRPLS